MDVPSPNASILEDKKKLIGVIVAVVVVAVFVGIIFLSKPSPPSAPPGGEVKQQPPGGLTTRAPAPANVVVPNMGQSVPPEVAPPAAVLPVNPNTAHSDRSFNIKAANNEFTPNTVILKAYDNLNLNITAVDKNYDFTQPDYGFNKFLIPKGQSKRVTFQVSASGKFTFYCATCGGPGKGPIGYVIVAP